MNIFMSPPCVDNVSNDFYLQTITFTIISKKKKKKFTNTAVIVMMTNI